MKIFLLILMHLFLNTSEVERADFAMELARAAFPDWKESYVVTKFDCSNQSAFVAEYLNFWGVETELRAGRKPATEKAAELGLLGPGHVWVVLSKSGRVVEATTLRLKSEEASKRYSEDWPIPVDLKAPNVVPQEFQWEEAPIFYIGGRGR